MTSPEVSVNQEQCKRVGLELKKLKLRPEFHQREFITFESDDETKLRVFLYSLAICHQTQKLYSSKYNIWGWEYLEKVFTELGKINSEILQPKNLATTPKKELIEKLQTLFTDDSTTNCTLDRIEERVDSLKDIGIKLMTNYDGKISNLVKASDSYLLNKGKGLYELLELFTAFKDPQRKKSTCFAKFASDAGLLVIRDQMNYIPIMDYHMQRVLLRTGCIDITNKALKEKLMHRTPVDSDEFIRDACIKATRLIASSSNHGVLAMNDFFWPLGRSCCHEKPLCQFGKCSKSPCTLEFAVNLDNHNTCILQQVCKATKQKEYLRFWQPIVNTNFY